MIEAIGLVKQYGDHVAVDHLNFKVEKGQILGFLGPNGAGKSTTMNMLTGYISATEGTILVNGYDMLEEPELAKKLTVDLMCDLLPDCEKYGVTICLENMPFRGHRISTMERIVEVLQIVNSPMAGICFDTGHSLVFDHDLGDMARLAAPYLKCLHVHDNDGTRDGHKLPYSSEGKGNWAHFVQALSEIGYHGVLSLECMGDIPDVPLALRKSYEQVTYMTGRYLADQIDKR